MGCSRELTPPPEGRGAQTATVAHLITPYLFGTGSWIHGQLVHAVRTRPVVLTQKLTEPEAFPFDPIFLIPDKMSLVKRLWNRAEYLVGIYNPKTYIGILRAENARLLHAHFGWEGARALGVARASGLPLITTFYGRDVGWALRKRRWRRRYPRLFEAGSAFVVEGPHLGTLLADQGCPADRIHVIHLGIDLERIPFAERSPLGDGPLEILVSASLRPKKGVVSAVRAFASIAADFPGSRLRILGDGPERGAVEAEIARHGLADRVSLEGYVSYDAHLAALTRARIFLAPSRTAPDGDSEGGAPVALIEAQAAGLPIISTRHADIPEIVADGESGLLAPEFDDAALAGNLRAILEQPDRWAAMGRAGRARMEREFNVRIQAQVLADLYESLI